MGEDGIFIWVDEDDWARLRQLLSPPALGLWGDLYPRAYRAGKYGAEMPTDPRPDPVLLQELVDAKEIEPIDGGKRYKHAGVARARAQSQASKAGKASVESRKATYGTAQPMRPPNSVRTGSERSARQGHPRTARTGSNRSEQTETETETEKDVLLEGGVAKTAVPSAFTPEETAQVLDATTNRKPWVDPREGPPADESPTWGDWETP